MYAFVSTWRLACSHDASLQAPHASRLPQDDVKLKKALERVLLRETGFEAVMRIRCSVGYKITHFYGHFHLRSADLMALPNIDEDKAMGVLIAHNPQAGAPLGNTFSIQVLFAAIPALINFTRVFSFRQHCCIG